MMISQDVAGIALEDNVALVIEDNQYRILKSADRAKAYKFYCKNGEVIKTEIHNKKLKNITEFLIEK